MGAHEVNKLTLSQQYQKYKRIVSDKVKSALVNDVPPGARLKSGDVPPTVAELRQFSNRHKLAELLPYESYDPDTELYYNRDTVGFMLLASPAVGIGPTELNVLNGIFNQAHKPNTTIQVSMLSDTSIEPILKRWSSSKDKAVNKKVQPIFDLMTKKRVDYLSTGKWRSLFSDQAQLVRNYHLVVSYTIPIPVGMATTDISEEDQDRLVRMKAAIRGNLRSAKMPSQNMTPEMFINIMDGFFNPSVKERVRLYYDENNYIGRQMVDEDQMMLFDSGAASIISENEHFSVIPYHVRQFPQKWAGYKNGGLIGNFTNNILRIPCPFIATLTINAPDQITAKGMVKNKSMRATQMADSPVAKFVPQWKERKQDWTFVAGKIDDGDKLMEAFYQINLFCPEGKEQECEQSLKSVYDSIGWSLSKSRYIPIHAFLGALPMGICEETKFALQKFGHYSTRLSWTCTNVAPWIGEWKGDPSSPMMTFVGRRGQLAFFDPFANKKGNYNVSTIAASGGGKSFYTQEWITNILGSGGRAFVMDSGGSYKNICEIYEGTYLEFGVKGDFLPCLNPFSTISEEDPEFFEDQMPLLKMLVAQMASPEGPLSQKQKSVLEKSITRCWALHKSKSNITKLVECLLADSTDDGPMHATSKDLAVMLYSYTNEGMYGKYFEGEANVDLSNPFVVLELDALSSQPDLRSVILLILMMRITQEMYLSGNKAQRKLCIIDEAWKLLKNKSAGDFIEEGFRVARKHGGSFMTITQKIGDYYTSESSKAAFANSDFIVYLRQKPEALEAAKAEGYITNDSGLIDVLLTLDTVEGQYSEMAISTPSGLSVCRFIVDPVTEKLFSTQPQEAQFIKNAEARGMTKFEAIEELLQRSQGR